jgi:HEAT repeat protein
MGLVKGKPNQSSSAGKPRRPSCKQLAAGLESADAAVRRHSARDMARCPNAVEALSNLLKQEEDVAVREAILGTLAKLKQPSAVKELVACLRSEDAALRNEAIETLKHISLDLSVTIKSLLSDPDADVRIFVVNILESRCEPDVEKWLIDVIERDQNTNVCAAAADLLCEVGTEAALDPLLRLKARFASEAYIQFASDLALKRIREA